MGHGQSKLKKKRASIIERRAEIERWLTDNPVTVTQFEAYDIMRMDATEIRDRIASGALTAETVTLVVCHAAWKSHMQTNCLTEIVFEDALSRARSLDLVPFGDRKCLHGLPVTVKDHFDIEGVDSTCGYSKFSFEPRAKNSLIVDILKENGAIIVAKSNIPQTLITFECSNPVFGRTLNPFHDDFSSGGSSGGEGALLGSHGIHLGWGSDIGGSIRIPSNFCGVYGLKPSTHRIPLDGNFGVDESESITAVAGPMANSVRDLKLSFETVVNSEPWERNATLLPLKFRRFAFPKDRPLRIGYYTDDGFITPTPACQRAVLETANKLRAAGHTVTEFEFPDGIGAASAFLQLINLEEGRLFQKPLGSDPYETTVGPILRLYYIPTVFKRITAKLLRWGGDIKAATFVESSFPKSFEDQFRLSEWRRQYRQRLIDEWKRQGDLDFVIAPVSAQGSIKHDTFHYQTIAACYTYTYNLIDFSVGVIPAIRIHSELDSKDKLKDKKDCSLLERMVYHHYDPKRSHGLPVGIQIVCKRWEEEKVLEAMKIVDDIIN